MAKDKSKKGWRSCATVLLVLLLVLLLAAGGVVYVVDHYLDKINKINPDDEYVIPPEDEDFETDEGAPEGPSSSAPGSSDTPSAPGSSVPPSSTPTTSAPPREGRGASLDCRCNTQRTPREWIPRRLNNYRQIS